MKAFQRNDGTRDKPLSMTYDGTNGREITEWSRDGDTSARFQHRPDLPDEPARVRVDEPFPQWVIVPKGATIAINREGNLELELPEPEPEQETA